MNNTKKWNFAGVVLGVVLVITGIVFVFSVGYSASTVTPGFGNNVEFGADFYTYQYDATLDIMQNTSTAAKNTVVIVENLAKYVGTAFIAWGLLTVIRYGKAIAVDKAACLANCVNDATQNINPTKDVDADPREDSRE